MVNCKKNTQHHGNLEGTYTYMVNKNGALHHLFSSHFAWCPFTIYHGAGPMDASFTIYFHNIKIQTKFLDYLNQYFILHILDYYYFVSFF